MKLPGYFGIRLLFMSMIFFGVIMPRGQQEHKEVRSQDTVCSFQKDEIEDALLST